MSTLKVQNLRTLDELDDIEKTWLALERSDPASSVFQSWKWNRLWCERVLPSRARARLHVLLLEDGAGRGQAILPLFEERYGGALAGLVQFVGHRLSGSHDVLLADPSEDLARSVVEALLDALDARQVLFLRHLDGAAAFTRQLSALGLAEPQVPRAILRRDPGLADPGQRLGSRRRRGLRQARNGLRRRLGPFDLQVCSTEEFGGAFDELIDLHHRRFSALGRTTLLVGPALEFVREAVLASIDRFEILRLRVRQQTIAAQLMVRDGRRYRAIQSGFDPEFAEFSPIRLIESYAIARGFDVHGCEIYDLGSGYEPYKFDWSPTLETSYMCCRGNRGALAWGLGAVIRTAFRRRCRPRGPELQIPEVRRWRRNADLV